MEQKKEWVLNLTTRIKTIFMEDFVFKQSIEAWIGILEFEKIKGLGKRGGTQRAYLPDSPPFCYFSKNSLSHNLPSFFFPSLLLENLQWPKMMQFKQSSLHFKGLYYYPTLFLILTFFLMITSILWPPTLCTNLAHLLSDRHPTPHILIFIISLGFSFLHPFPGLLSLPSCHIENNSVFENPTPQ